MLKYSLLLLIPNENRPDGTHIRNNSFPAQCDSNCICYGGGVVSEKSREPKERVRKLIEALRAGADPEKVKAEFKDILGGMESPDITVIEDELVADGLPPGEIHRLCDVHLAVFKEATEKAKVEVSPGHPVYILLEEHRFVRDVVEVLCWSVPI
jgi:hypothetical protein